MAPRPVNHARRVSRRRSKHVSHSNTPSWELVSLEVSMKPLLVNFCSSTAWISVTYRPDISDNTSSWGSELVEPAPPSDSARGADWPEIAGLYALCWKARARLEGGKPGRFPDL
jgi:hypothetical protein